MTLVRPVADIASFPAPGWTATPLFEKVDAVEPDDSIFITALAPGAEDPQVALQIDDLGIPYGASGQIVVRVRMRWSDALTAEPETVRIGLGNVSALGVTDPVLLFQRNVAGFSSTEFETIELVFTYTDWTGVSDAFGVYVEMTPDAADVTQFGEISWIEVEACVPAVVIGQCPHGTTTAGQVITEARDWHPSFDQRRHPNGSLMRLLSSYQREVTGKIARVNPALLATPVTYALPLADFNEGMKLPQRSYIMPAIEVRYTQNSDVAVTIELVNLTRRIDRDLIPNAAYVRGDRLFLTGRAENWAPFGSLTVNMVLTPKELTALTDVVMLPDWGMDAYVSALVRAMAIRGGLSGDILGAAAEAEQQFLDTVAQQRAAETSYTRDVFPGGW